LATISLGAAGERLGRAQDHQVKQLTIVSEGPDSKSKTPGDCQVPAAPDIYVVRQSELLTGACEGSAFHIHALAAVLWHEMAHLNGASEHDARKKEEAL
jgi:hypothetical protein